MVELANITSVQVTWNQPEGGLAVDEYVVSYRRLNGRDGQCSSFQDGGNETVRAGREGVPDTSILQLQAYSVYCCIVTARKNNGALHNITSFNFATNSTGIISLEINVACKLLWSIETNANLTVELTPIYFRE